MIFMIFRYHFWHWFWLHVGTLLVYIGILSASFFLTCSLLFHKECFWRFLFHFGNLLDLFWYPFGTLLASLWHPFGSHLTSFWFPLASFFLFAARHGILMHFRMMYSDFASPRSCSYRGGGTAALPLQRYIYIYIYMPIYFSIEKQWLGVTTKYFQLPTIPSQVGGTGRKAVRPLQYKWDVDKK